MKNILVLVGSGQKNGNTNKLADAFIKGATEAGHNVKNVFLGDKQINGCLGCNACQKNNICILKDDMQDIYPIFDQCDTVVLASPLYFWTISARIKIFVERLYARWDWGAENEATITMPKRDCVLLMTAEDDNFWTFEQAIAYYRFTYIKYLNWTDKGLLLAGNCGGSGEKRHIEDTGYLETAFKFGKAF